MSSGLATAAVEFGVERVDRLVVVAQTALVARGELARRELQSTAQALEAFGVATHRRESGGLLLECFAQFVEGGDARRREFAHLQHARRRGRGEPVGLEAGERFAHGGSRDAEAIGLLDLGERGARREHAVEDLLAERTIGAITGSHSTPPPSLCIHCRGARRNLAASCDLDVYTNASAASDDRSRPAPTHPWDD